MRATLAASSFLYPIQGANVDLIVTTKPYVIRAQDIQQTLHHEFA